ncbi:hypothetical protein PQX77_007962, partial [Marasmius sp. AFHP31]
SRQLSQRSKVPLFRRPSSLPQLVSVIRTRRPLLLQTLLDAAGICSRIGLARESNPSGKMAQKGRKLENRSSFLGVPPLSDN